MHLASYTAGLYHLQTLAGNGTYHWFALSKAALRSSNGLASKWFSELLCLNVCCADWQEFTAVHVCDFEDSSSDASNLSFLQAKKQLESICNLLRRRRRSLQASASQQG